MKIKNVLFKPINIISDKSDMFMYNVIAFNVIVFNWMSEAIVFTILHICVCIISLYQTPEF